MYPTWLLHLFVHMPEYDTAMGNQRLYLNLLTLTAKKQTHTSFGAVFSCARVEGPKPGSMCVKHVIISVGAILYWLLREKYQYHCEKRRDVVSTPPSIYSVTGSQICKSTR